MALKIANNKVNEVGDRGRMIMMGGGNVASVHLDRLVSFCETLCVDVVLLRSFCECEYGENGNSSEMTTPH